jgi:hypothetical protein
MSRRIIRIGFRCFNRLMRSLSSICLAAWALGAGAAETTKADFNRDIRPLLSDRCFTCHGPDSAARKGKLRLDVREAALKALDDGWAVIKPGDPAKSEVVHRIFTDDEDDVMPPPKSNLKLSAEEKELLKRWIAEGAEYQPHWAFIPVGKVAVPGDADPGSGIGRPASGPIPDSRFRIPDEQAPGALNPIDAFVRAGLGKRNLAPAASATRETLIRRVSFGLTGLPPKPSEIAAFLGDTTPNAYSRMVDKFLASPAYGERMAMDWLDLARYADTYGYQADVYRDMSPWRDWVISAFNRNLSYDQFLVWQLAGDLLPNATDEQRLATAFNRLHRQTNEGGSIDDEFRTEYVMDRVNTVGTAMLGLTVECARCHDHKYDPISQRDYYSLFAFFNSIDESGMYSHFTRATPSPSLPLWKSDQSAERAVLALRRLKAEEALAKAEASAQRGFQQWLKASPMITAPSPVARFAFDTVTNGATPNALGTNVASLADGPALVAGHDGQALRFSGDNSVTCKGEGHFGRTDSFSLNVWLKPATLQDRAVLLHHSVAAEDAGRRGYEVLLDHGRPFFNLCHFWPGDAVAVRAKSALPTNEWSRLTVTYDGSSAAAGLRIYRDGVPLETETIRDHLTKDIQYRKEWGDSSVGQVSLMLGARFRDSGFKDGLIDDLQIFDQCLTAVEVAAMGSAKAPAEPSGGSTEVSQAKAAAGQSHGVARIASSFEDYPQAARREPSPYQADLFQHFLVREHAPYRAAQVELRSVRVAENELRNGVREIMVMEEMAKPRPAFILDRGAYDAPGAPVGRDTPAAVLSFPDDLPRDRLGLARWMVDRRNPLTARVAVNRVWKLHFGTGLVATPENFGVQGAQPSQPELLDWLAGWFMDSGWDVKALHRLILASRTFQQTSVATKERVEADPENRWLARGPKHRLQAEEIRDAALAASGLLVAKVGGPSVKPYQPAGLWESSGTGASYQQDTGENLYRRSLYTYWKRTAPPPAMITFDAVTREVCTAKRETTTTPLQALVLLNDPQFIEASRVLGERLLKAHPADLDARIGDAFVALVGRRPDDREAAIGRQLFAEQRALFAKDTAAAEKLVAVGDSKPDASLPPVDLAATTALVSAVMNFDEFVMKR